MAEKLQKLVHRAVFPSPAVSLEPFAHRRNIATFFRYCFGRCLSELAELVPLSYSNGFSVTIPRCYKDLYVNIFYSGKAKVWNFLPAEWFPLSYDLNGFKFRMSRYLLSLGSF